MREHEFRTAYALCADRLSGFPAALAYALPLPGAAAGGLTSHHLVGAAGFTGHLPVPIISIVGGILLGAVIGAALGFAFGKLANLVASAAVGVISMTAVSIATAAVVCGGILLAGGRRAGKRAGNRVLRIGASALPPEERERYLEEWRDIFWDLAEHNAPVTLRIAEMVDILRSIPVLAVTLRTGRTRAAGRS